LKWYAEKIRKKYGWTGKKYEGLMAKIIANNTENTSKAIARIQRDDWNKTLNKISSDKTPVILPDIQDVLPKRSVYIRKGAEKGKLICDTLRDKLTKDLRQTVTDYMSTAEVREYYVRGGRQKDVISPELINEFQNKIKNTFENYTKKDPKYGVPSNIKAIAITETRATINDIKDQYMRKLVEKNQGKIELTKTWIHNNHLSKEARIGHKRLNGVTIPINENFKLENWIKIGKSWFLSGVLSCRHPHDPSLPAGQVISCNCDVIYSAKKI